MVPRTWVPVTVFAAGVAAIVAAVATGEAKVSLLVIFPVFTGSSLLFLLGIVLILLSFVVGFAMLAMGQAEAAKFATQRQGELRSPEIQKKTQYGGVVLVGPLPIAFGSDKKIAFIMLIVGIVVALTLLAILLLSL